MSNCQLQFWSEITLLAGVLYSTSSCIFFQIGTASGVVGLGGVPAQQRTVGVAVLQGIAQESMTPHKLEGEQIVPATSL